MVRSLHPLRSKQLEIGSARLFQWGLLSSKNRNLRFSRPLESLKLRERSIILEVSATKRKYMAPNSYLRLKVTMNNSTRMDVLENGESVNSNREIILNGVQSFHSEFAWWDRLLHIRLCSEKAINQSFRSYEDIKQTCSRNGRPFPCPNMRLYKFPPSTNSNTRSDSWIR